MSITEADLIDVYEATFDARAKWRNILLCLRLSSDTVDSIGERWQDNPDDCYREGLKEWLKGEERSWRDVAKALFSPTVGYDGMAKTIERDHVQPTGATASSTAVQATVPTPYQQKIGDNLVIFTKEKIGNGAFGVVFKGSYRGRYCAVKVLHDVATQIQTNLPMVGKNENNQTFDQECELLMSFKHINIVQHLSTDKHPMSGSTLLVTELMDCSLRSYLSDFGEESLSSQCEISLSKDIASGLAYIHSKHIIHRDLCGDNILLILSESLPLAKISDFGMSRLLDTSLLSSTLTAVAYRMGYLPNEALKMNNQKYDYSLDVFSFGVIMVQIVRKQETIKSAKDRSFHVTKIPRTHRLRSLIDSCLQQNMTRRPTARHLCAALERKSELRPPLTLKWRRGKDMPIKMGTTVQSVVIDDAVFVGGGWADNNFDCTVMKFDIQQDRWTTLPQYNVSWFAMTSVDNQLLVVGGYKSTTLLTLFRSGEWTHPYPPMKIPRHYTTAVSVNGYIIVAGGWGDQGRILSSVEVLDITARKWYTAQSLPKPHLALKSTLIGSTLYLMGGQDHTGHATKMVYHVDLNELIIKAVSNQDTPTLWQTIKDTPLKWSAPLSIGRSLLAVGGHDDSKPSSSIHLYQPDSRRWVKVGDLLTPRYCCTCSVLPSGEVIVAGGQTASSSYLNTVDFLVSVS